jgi:protein-L-isoaspartate(D-aspartate) O-methyltransferase
MEREQELAIVRRAYAKQLFASVGLNDPRLEAVFATVQRERYLGPGPWPILRYSGYVATPDSDPVYLYADVLIGIVPERGLNNGMPSYHAPIIASAALQEGEHVVHIGAGTGYYTAIMARLVGTSGKVTAIEFDPILAARARDNFASSSNVTVIEGDGAAIEFEPADVIYVNAGATRPADRWLDGLTNGGRLILPLTRLKRTQGDLRNGYVFRIERRVDDYFARALSRVAVYPCEGAGARDEASEAALGAAIDKDTAMKTDGWKRVTRLYRSDAVPEDRCWLRAPGWALAYE